MGLNSLTPRQTATVGGGVGAAVVALALPFIAQWEGKSNTAYRDIVGVLTVCYGETDPKYAYEGATYTDQECWDMLDARVWEFYRKLDPMMTNRNIPVSVQFGLLELLYNVGEGNVRSSTILRLANAGDYAGACAQLDRWVNAGGVRVRGLVNRRNASEAMCIRDI